LWAFLEAHAKIQRLRALRSKPYTQKEAEAAVGLRTDNGTRSTTLDTTIEDQPAAMEVDIADKS